MQVFVWIGKGANETEKKEALTTALVCLLYELFTSICLADKQTTPENAYYKQTKTNEQTNFFFNYKKKTRLPDVRVIVLKTLYSHPWISL